MNKKFEATGFFPADILLPKGNHPEKWAVVACDQFTSQPEYWKSLEETVGEEPSTLRLILPEARLNDADVEDQIKQINGAMERYLANGVFRTLPESMIYVRRTQSDSRVRQGLVGKIDLEQYDFTPGSGALIRATEGTVLERIPPRVRVREHAPVELPHVMLLIDDPAKQIIEPLGENCARMEQVYDMELLAGGGHLSGWQLTAEQMDDVAESLQKLCDPALTTEKYGLGDAAPLLFAVGDGNHSLATAKACYEQEKNRVPQEQWATLPSRYALVEVVNNHDDALSFEPIHRVLFGVEPEDLLAEFKKAYPNAYEGKGEGHTMEVCWEGATKFVTVPDPKVQLAVGTLQSFLDDYLKTHDCEVDYIHGDDVTRELGSRPGNMGFLLPAMGKEQLFKTVMADGVLPRKTFSMGHAQDKRYYMEARVIK